MSTAISIGWNCESAILGIKKGLRQPKKKGYKTCVFDLMVSNYPGIILCLQDDFYDFLNTAYITTKVIGGEIIIYHTKYNFWFNHESPGHADLYKLQKWKNGKYHFVNNNFKKFVERYRERIENFRNYIYSGKHIQFIIERFNSNYKDDIPELITVIKRKYPHLRFDFIFVPHLYNSSHTIEYIRTHLIEMGFTENDEEIKRLNYTNKC